MTVAMLQPGIEARRHHARQYVAGLATLCGLVALGAFASGPMGGTVTEMMIRMVVVVGLYIFVGNSGIISFGHISFMSIGAYAAAWLTCCTLPMVKPLYLPGLPEWLQNTAAPFWVGLLAAAILSGLSAFVLGLALMRLSGIAASIATFGLLAVQFNVYTNWESVTAGHQFDQQHTDLRRSLDGFLLCGGGDRGCSRPSEFPVRHHVAGRAGR